MRGCLRMRYVWTRVAFQQWFVEVLPIDSPRPNQCNVTVHALYLVLPSSGRPNHHWIIQHKYVSMTAKSRIFALEKLSGLPFIAPPVKQRIRRGRGGCYLGKAKGDTCRPLALKAISFFQRYWLLWSNRPFEQPHPRLCFPQLTGLTRPLSNCADGSQVPPAPFVPRSWWVPSIINPPGYSSYPI